MKILVIGGMHGNEPLGIELVKMLTDNPVNNVEAVIANEVATKYNVRFNGTDLNRTFPGVRNSLNYEKLRAAELIDICKEYDLVLDFHNTNCPENDCGFVGQDADNQLYDITSWLGLQRVIVADYDCLNKYAPNCLSVEISLSSPKNQVALWYKKISQLAELGEVPSSDDLEKFRFVYRITIEDRDKLQLRTKQLKAFQPIDKKLADAMNVKSPAFPIFIGDAYTPYNYGGLLNRL